MDVATATRPTAGQLALARLLADGGTRANHGITHVDAAAYTSPDRHAAEQARIFTRAALVARAPRPLTRPRLRPGHLRPPGRGTGRA